MAADGGADQWVHVSMLISGPIRGVGTAFDYLQHRFGRATTANQQSAIFIVELACPSVNELLIA